MSAIWLLLGLLVLSYVGTILVGGRTIRGFGLPSGAEYVLLGFVLGPRVLGVIGGTLVTAFAPILVVGCGWLALVAGTSYCQVGLRKVRLSRAVSGILLASLVAAGVACAVYLGLVFAPELEPRERLLLAGSAAAVSCETTRHAVRWVVERHGARGQLSDTLADYARVSVLVPALIVAVLFAAAPEQGLSALSIPARAGLTLFVGVLLGLVASVLLGREFRRDESWGILLGSSLLGIGIATRLGQSAIATTFFMGLTVALVSPHRSEIKTMTAPTEKPVVLPVAVLAGASVHPEAAPFALLLIGVGLAARLLIELVRGWLVSSFVRAARPAGPLLGAGMVSTGAFSLAVAVALALRLPHALGDSILTYAAASLLMGELFGPVLLRRALTLAGDIGDDARLPAPPNIPLPPSGSESP